MRKFLFILSFIFSFFSSYGQVIDDQKMGSSPPYIEIYIRSLNFQYKEVSIWVKGNDNTMEVPMVYKMLVNQQFHYPNRYRLDIGIDDDKIISKDNWNQLGNSTIVFPITQNEYYLIANCNINFIRISNPVEKEMYSYEGSTKLLNQ